MSRIHFARFMRFVLVVTNVACLIGCSAPVVKLSPELLAHPVKSVVVLPPKYARGIATERVTYVRSKIIEELRKREIRVIEPQIIDAECPTSECPTLARFLASNKLDGALTVSLRSIEQTNFIAGYYNAVIGDIVLHDSSGRFLGRTDHTESNRGGLIFNSNQVVEGIISQVRNSQEDSFPVLAQRFAQTTIAGLFPVPATAAQSATPIAAVPVAPETVNPPKIILTTAQSAGNGLLKICAMGSPNNIATLGYRRQKASLRESSPGNYCGIFLDGPPFTQSDLQVELRSHFGETTTAAIRRAIPQPCTSKSAIVAQPAGQTTRVSLRCDGTSTAVAWYKAATAAGPYRPIKGANMASFVDQTHPGTAPIYAAVVTEPKLATNTPLILAPVALKSE